MTHAEFKALWNRLDEDQRDSVRAKAAWEGMTLWAVCESYPGIWDEEDRLETMREIRREFGHVEHLSPQQMLARSRR